eukprot:TRINITY_DN14858_c0_g1_i1.p1 TRINITY_DN14858_c0_g1~~TRINITY_DN14858_c0_g1_i1.p1  ORF type:complete len:158 (+),score=11.63 TRINITY_DN14858_c0_g1_i1:172-645(+)
MPSDSVELHKVPSLDTNSLSFDQELYIKAKKGLQTHDAKGASIPCQEEEMEAITAFLLEKFNNSKGGCLLISGCPGTGKTLTVNAAVRQFLLHDGIRSRTKVASVNCMTLPDPSAIISSILSQVAYPVSTWTKRKRLPDSSAQLLRVIEKTSTSHQL